MSPETERRHRVNETETVKMPAIQVPLTQIQERHEKPRTSHRTPFQTPT
jgi:hypothetical protein